MKASIGVNLVTSLSFAIIFSFTRNVVLGHDHPIIGILAQEQTDDVVANLHPHTSMYIYATYVKAVESAGARVVPILPEKDESYYRKLLSSINGVVLPGGEAILTPDHPFYDAASIIYEIAVEFNQQGIYFPIFGICQGFEFLMVYASKNLDIQKKCDVRREMLPLQFTLPPLKTAQYPQLHLNELYTLQYTDSTPNLHSWCTLVDDFKNNPHLGKDWKITAISTGKKDKVEFIASFEHRKYPFFGVQFHPEVVPFEWSSATLYPRSEELILANQYFFRTLIRYARENDNTFAGKKGENENNLLIYNYPVYYTLYNAGRKRQIYLF